MPDSRLTGSCRPLAIMFVTAALGCASLTAFASESGSGESVLPGSDSHRLVHASRSRSLEGNGVHPGTPMMLDPDFGGFPFNVGDRETRKLKLQLTEPLVIESGSRFRADGDSGLLGLDATLSIPVGGGLSFSGRADQLLGRDQFQSLGSIHCDNGILRSDSYTASGCRFVGERGGLFDRRTLSMGPQLDIGNVSTSLRWFTSEALYGGAGIPAANPWPSPLDGALPMAAESPLLPGSLAASQLAGQTTGIDLDFQVGFTTDQAGEIRLGLALTRIYGAEYDVLDNAGHSGLASPLQWNVAQPFDTASLGIEWNHGAFSGGLRGWYREPVSFLDRSELDGMGTFDVHFTWRTPWNANLSVGAGNVLNAGVGADSGPAADKPADRFESIYGRIPYVRYQQDL